jgi:hypothetical protein
MRGYLIATFLYYVLSVLTAVEIYLGIYAAAAFSFMSALWLMIQTKRFE